MEPYTQYEIWVEAIVNGSSSPASDHVSSSLIQFDPIWSNLIQFCLIWSFLINFDPFQVYARTDIKEPSAPTTVNVTCYDTGQLYVSWSRPDKYHKSVDYYKIFYKSASDGVFDVITIESTEKNSSPNVSLKIDLVDFLFMKNTGYFIAKWKK